MSIQIKAANGGGSVELDVPNTVNSDFALTVPAAAGVIDRLERAGNILQVKQTVKTDVESFVSANTNTFVDIPGMSVSITPTFSTSKILVLFNVNLGQTSTATIHMRLMRGSTSIYQGDADSNRFGSTQIIRHNGTPYTLNLEPLSGQYLDSPATTSATTYKIAGTLGVSYNGTFYLNRSGSNTDNDFVGRTASSITVMEVAA